MKALFVLIFSFTLTFSFAQNSAEVKTQRKGFIFGAAAGVSLLNLKFPSHSVRNHISASVPNFKIGAMISNRTALLVYLPGSIYKYKSEVREQGRGFEAITPSVQYWLKDRLWILGGAGVGMDAPVFYDVKSEDEGKFYFGNAVIASIGYEFYQRKNFAIDLQGRVHYGSANRPEGRRDGTALSFLVGINWY